MKIILDHPCLLLLLTCSMAVALFRSGGNIVQPTPSIILVNPCLDCRYSCRSGGGCDVRYVGPARSGRTKGSCGGSPAECSGTPPECRQCNRAITCSRGSGGGTTFSGVGTWPSRGGSWSSWSSWGGWSSGSFGGGRSKYIQYKK